LAVALAAVIGLGTPASAAEPKELVIESAWRHEP